MDPERRRRVVRAHRAHQQVGQDQADQATSTRASDPGRQGLQRRPARPRRATARTRPTSGGGPAAVLDRPYRSAPTIGRPGAATPAQGLVGVKRTIHMG